VHYSSCKGKHELLVVTNKEVGLEVSTKKMKYVYVHVV
jgi:hypothetical protein